MFASELFDPTQTKFTKICRGSWLKSKDFLVCIMYRYLHMQAIIWHLDGTASGHYMTGISFLDPVDTPLTKKQLLEILGNGILGDLDKWEILTNKEAADIIAKLPTTSL